MRISKIETNSLNNGPGIRLVVWCQGCSLKCNNCHNPESWDACGGREFTDDDTNFIMNYLNYNYVAGVTLSGGHPLEDYNIVACTELCKGIKSSFNEKTIWLYTGRLWEDVKDLPIMKYVDVLVDGPYIDELRDISLPYRGSKNQRVIDVQKSLKKNKPILYEAP